LLLLQKNINVQFSFLIKMRKKSILTLSLLCIVAAAFAQEQPAAPPQTDALKTRFFNSIEYVNCRLADFSINSSKDTKLQAAFMSQCKCNPNGGTDANLKAFFNKNKLAKNARIFAMTDSLKGTYTAGMSNDQLAASITGFLASPKLTNFASTKEGYPSFTSNLSAEIDGIFAQSSTTTAAAEPVATTNGLEPAPIQDATQVSQSSWSKLMTFLITFLLGIVGGGIGMRYYTLQRAKERAAARRAASGNTLENETDEDNYSPDSVHLETQITDLQRELERQQSLNAQLRMRLEQATNPPLPPRAVPPSPIIAPAIVTPEPVFEIDEPDFVETPTAPTVELEIAAAPIEPVAPSGPPVFFMRIPTYDGLFNDLRKSDAFRPAESVYEFTQTSKTTASFVLVTDAPTQLMAIQGFSMYIAPACETNDMFPEYDAERITTIEPGEAIKEGDLWRVVKKAVVELS
jgi:hypothetical protein